MLGRMGRYVVREVVLAWLAVTSVLVVVLLTNRLVDFLTRAVDGDVPSNVVFTLLGLKALGGIGKVLPASFFLGIMLGLGRLYRDAEMTAMTACGLGPPRLYAALFTVAVPLAMLGGALSLYIAPWSERTAERTLVQARQEAQFDALSPGRFVRVGDDRAVIFVGGVADDGTLEDVFARLRAEQGSRLVTAAGARRRLTDDGTEYLVLENGERYDIRPGDDVGWRVLTFGDHGVQLDKRQPVKRRPKRDEVATSQLWGSPDPKDRAELEWRLAMPEVTLVLAFIALPLSATGSRQGRYGKLLVAVLICAVYLNLLKIGQEWLEEQTVPAAIGLWWVHAVFVVIGAGLLAWQYGLLARVRRG